MSTIDSGRTEPSTLDVSGTPRVPFARLVAVEARKMTDTRAGFWLLLLTGLLMLAVAGIALLVIVLNDLSPAYMTWATQIMTLPVSLLLPVFAITTVTSEWGQRTSLVTFALEPHRSRVLLAKFVTVLALAVTTMVLALLLAAVGAALQGAFGESASWEVDGGPLFWAFMTQLLYFVMAFGLGLVLLNSAGAVVLYYVVALLLPVMVWGPVYGLVSWGPDVIPWFDLGFAIAPLTGPGMLRPDEVYAQIATSTLIWVVLPVAIGLRRALRTELK